MQVRWVLDGRTGPRGEGDCRVGKALRASDPHAERIEVPLEGGTVVGNLRRPAGEERPPLALLVPGLDSTKEEFFRLENVFLDRGMATLSIDGPGQGECGFELPIRPDYEVAVAAVLDQLSGATTSTSPRRPSGRCLGVYYAPRVAAFEPRVKRRWTQRP